MSINRVFAVCNPGIQSCSSSYSTDQTFFGSGGELNSCSSGGAAYCSKQSVGSLGVGQTSSTSYDAFAGFITPEEPFLALVVNATTVNLGVLNTSSAATGTGTFSVRTSLSSAYAVKTMSQPPKSEGGIVLTGLAAASASSPGTEQFGINLVANTSPATFGTNPANFPDNTYADGAAAPGYDTPNQYKYGVGNTIAQSPNTAGNQAWGQTNFTISYLANVSSITRAGHYTMFHDIVAVATY